MRHLQRFDPLRKMRGDSSGGGFARSRLLARVFPRLRDRTAPRPTRRQPSSAEFPLCPRLVPGVSGNREKVARLPRTVSWPRRAKGSRSPAFARFLPDASANARNRASSRDLVFSPVLGSRVSFFVIAGIGRKSKSTAHPARFAGPLFGWAPSRRRAKASANATARGGRNPRRNARKPGLHGHTREGRFQVLKTTTAGCENRAQDEGSILMHA